MMRRTWEKGGYICSLDMVFSRNEMMFLPTLTLQLGMYGGYKVVLGFLTFKVSFDKVYMLPKDMLRNIMKDLTSSI